MVDATKTTLSRAELNSPVWQKVTKILEERIEVLRRKNDGDLDAEATAKLRGRIAELKFLLELGEIREPATTTDAG